MAQERGHLVQAHAMGERRGDGDGEPLLVAWSQIDEATPRSFRFILLFPDDLQAAGGVPLNEPREDLTEALLRERGWHVEWLGVEGG